MCWKWSQMFVYTCIVIPKHILCLGRQIHNLNFKKSPAAIASTKPMLVFFRLPILCWKDFQRISAIHFTCNFHVRNCKSLTWEICSRKNPAWVENVLEKKNAFSLPQLCWHICWSLQKGSWLCQPSPVESQGFHHYHHQHLWFKESWKKDSLPWGIVKTLHWYSTT